MTTTRQIEVLSISSLTGIGETVRLEMSEWTKEAFVAEYRRHWEKFVSPVPKIQCLFWDDADHHASFVLLSEYGVKIAGIAYRVSGWGTSV